MGVENEGSVFGKAGKRSGGHTTPAIDDLLAASQAILKGAESGQFSGGRTAQQSDVLGVGLGQLSEAMTTGGIGARLPVVQRAVEASRSASSNALRGIDSRLAQTNLAGTPFGENIRAGAQMTGAVRAADIPSEVNMQMIAQLLPLLSLRDPSMLMRLEGMGLGLQGMSSAAGAQAAVLGADTEALARQKNNFWDNTASGMRMGSTSF